MGDIGLGLELMVVGMCTVFLILVIVIWGGKLLINVVNRMAPEEEAAAPKTQKAAQPIDGATMEVLREAVRQLTGGKGRVSSVKRL